MIVDYVFFFSSRRRHTRYWRDWSSDVCSSDLEHPDVSIVYPVHPNPLVTEPVRAALGATPRIRLLPPVSYDERSEERRVGKECRSRWWSDQSKKNSIEDIDIS